MFNKKNKKEKDKPDNIITMNSPSNKPNLDENARYNIKINKLLDRYVDKYREENDIDEKYHILNADEFAALYFNYINSGIQIIFSNNNYAMAAASLIMKSEIMNSISYIAIQNIVTIEGTYYILQPVYNEKKELLLPEQEDDLYHALNIELLTDGVKQKVRRGEIIIDDLFLR